MGSRIHSQARTTPNIRQEIRDSGLSDREAAKVFNITRATAAKWLKRDDVQDRSHRAHRKAGCQVRQCDICEPILQYVVGSCGVNSGHLE
jgi:hypothetical protein